jgi:hypothetical protein
VSEILSGRALDERGGGGEDDVGRDYNLLKLKGGGVRVEETMVGRDLY